MKQFTRVISLPHVQANWMTEDAELQQLSIFAISIHPFGSFSSVFFGKWIFHQSAIKSGVPHVFL